VNQKKILFARLNINKSLFAPYQFIKQVLANWILGSTKNMPIR